MTRREALGLVALGLAFRLVFFHGFVGSDDAVYVDQAHRITQGERTWEPHPHNQRHGMIYPLAGLLAVGGGAFPVLALFPLSLSVAGILVARDLGERLGGSASAGRAAALLLAALPIDVLFASQLFPDLPASALVAIALWLLVRSDRPAVALGAGLLVGWSLLVKESMVVFLPFLAGWLFCRNRRVLLPWAAGLALPLLADVIAAGVATGDPLFHLHAVREGRHATHLYRPLSGPGEVPARLLLRFPGLLLDPRQPSIVQYGLTGLLGVFGLGVALLHRPRRSAAALWLLSAYVLYVLWPASLAPYVPAIPVEQRYLALLSIPLCLVAGQGVAYLAERFGRAARQIVLGGAIAASVAGSTLYAVQYRGAVDNARAFLAWREDAAPEAPIVTDPVGNLVLPFLSGYDPSVQVRPFPPEPGGVPRGALVLVDEKRLGFGGEDARQPVPDWVRSPPATWAAVWSGTPEPSAGARAVARLVRPLLPADARARLLRRDPAVAFAAASSITGPASLPTFLPAAPRIVAIGDLHGDLEATRRALRLAGAIDGSDRWIGGRLVVVQTGDQLDRGDEERAILDLLARLATDAAAAGGAVHALNGNHEIMNARSDLRYVTEGGFAEFSEFAEAAGAATPSAGEGTASPDVPAEQRGRVAAFRPGGPYARRLADRRAVLVIGDNVFVHAGVRSEHLDYGLERANAEMRAWLLGEAPEPEWVGQKNNLVWTRLYSDEPEPEACTELATVLERLEAARMIVGHTVQEGGITSRCDGRVWCIDVGLAAAYGGPLEVLEISGGSVRVLREEPAAVPSGG